MEDEGEAMKGGSPSMPVTDLYRRKHKADSKFKHFSIANVVFFIVI